MRHFLNSLRNTKTQIFYPFDLSPPSEKICLQALYHAFEDYLPVRGRGGYCEQCFSSDWVASITSACNNKRKAPVASFAGLLWESVHCAGGVANIKFWLPRALETYILTVTRWQYEMLEVCRRLQAIGLSVWPEYELHILRAVFCRSLIGWINERDPAPLGGEFTDCLQDHEQVCICLCAILIYLRVEPESIFSYLKNSQNESALYFLIREISNGNLLQFPFHFENTDQVDSDSLEKITGLLANRARSALFRVISQDGILELWLASNENNHLLRTALEEAESCYNEQKMEQSQAAMLEDALFLKPYICVNP